MAETIDATQSLYRALLTATPDMVLMLSHDRVLGVAPGGFSWLDSAGLKSYTMPELLSKEDYEAFEQSREAALGNPGQRVDMDALVSPEKFDSWKAVGMQKPTYLQLRLVAIEGQQLLCVIRDTTQLKTLEKISSSDVMRDPLTGLRSHRSLMPVLEKAVGDSKRFEEAVFSLIIIDIDRFSEINEKYGWDAGDEVLRAIGDVLDQQRRSSDYLCRFGGDLFAMLLTETRVEQAVGAGHRVQKLVGELSFSFTDEPLNLKVSVGVATYNENIEKPLDMVQTAQDNVLIAISSGGNQVVGPV